MEEEKKEFNPMIITTISFLVDTVYLGLPILSYAEENKTLSNIEILQWSFGEFSICWIVYLILFIELLVYIIYQLTK